jgi:hypothetical protein
MLLAKTYDPFTGVGPLGTLQGGSSGAAVFCQFENIISLVIGVLTVAAGLWFIFQLFGGALGWLSSGGEKQALQNAQKRIVNSIIGLIIVIGTYTLIGLISAIFGLKILSPFTAISGGSSGGCTSISNTSGGEDNTIIDPKSL